MGRLETNGYYALGVPLYLALVALELFVFRKKKAPVYGFADTLGNASAGLGEIVIGLFLGPFLLGLYDFGMDHIALVRWPAGSIVPWVLAFFLGDLCYYAYHRAGHSVGGLWAIHGVHHQTEKWNLSIALRHPWFSDVYSAVFYIPLPLCGVPPGHFFIAITIISFYALTIHGDLFRRPGLWLFVTPQTHILHHARNPRYLNKNYGAMFTLWDRMFGTYAEQSPDEPVELGTSFGYETHDGALSQWIYFRKLIGVARQAATWRERVLVFVMPPGFRPAGVPAPKRTPARSDAEIPTATKAYAAVQLALTSVFAVYVLWLRDAHPPWMLASAAAVILWSLSTIGGLLDGRAASPRREVGRLFATLALGVALATAPRYLAVGAGVAAAAVISAAWIAAARRRMEPVASSARLR